MEAKIAKPGELLTACQYLVVNFKLGKINIEFKLENRKKILTIAIYRNSVNMQKNTLKKLNHGKKVKPAFKYMKDIIDNNLIEITQK